MTATFELPGLNKENVSIDVHNNLLTVSGESKFESDRDEHGYVVRERRFGKFSRALPLPQGIKVCALYIWLRVPVCKTWVLTSVCCSPRRSRLPWRTAF